MKIKAQKQNIQPGKEFLMDPKPIYKREKLQQRLKDKVIIITGGDSGIGRAAAIACAQEGAKIVIAYFNEDEDAKLTVKEIEDANSKCLALKGDIKDPNFCKEIIEKTINDFGKLDVLINNAAVQYYREDIQEIEREDLLEVFETNIFSFVYLIKYACPYLKEGSSIINTASVVAYRGSKDLLDYSLTKGAIVALTRSLSKRWAEKGIRVNAVAPGPIWTPLIPSSFGKDAGEEAVEDFGSFVPMKRAGQPAEVAPAYVFLASEDSSYMTGQVIHVNGGEIVGG